MTIEVVSPAYKIGDRVQSLTGSRPIGTIVKIYPASQVPLWYGTRRIVHTHCYQLKTDRGFVWGLVDAELTPITEEE